MACVAKTSLLTLPEDAVSNIRKIYNLDKPERLEEALNILHSWIQKQNHMIKKDYSRDYLEKTLISCKGSVEKAKKQIDSLSTMKTLLPKFFKISNIKEELEGVLDIVKLVPLPEVTKEYYRAVLVKLNDKNLTADSFLMYYQYSIILTEYLKANDYINGMIIIDDFRDVNFMDIITKMNTTELQQFVSILVEGYGARLKGIHILTESKAVDIFVKTLKHFLPAKIADRIHVHSAIESLHDVVPKEILPEEYGGKQQPLNELLVQWVDELSTPDHQKHMEVMNKAATDENLRNSCKFNEEYLGMPGSFRNMSVD